MANYQLVAWTEKGQVKMLPSLVAELAEPYVETLKDLQAEPRQWAEGPQTAQLLRLSRAHEDLARFFLRVGYWQDAFLQFVEAATTVTDCTDVCWKDSDYGYFLHRPLENRFLAMYRRCEQLALEHPEIRGSAQWQELDKDWEMVTRPYRVA